MIVLGVISVGNKKAFPAHPDCALQLKLEISFLSGTYCFLPNQLETLKCFGCNAPYLGLFCPPPPPFPIPLVHLAALSESDAWAAPLSGPESSLTRPFPAGSKLKNPLHIALHVIFSLE